ncbi:DUF3025 domain-containing protein [Chitiniphilus purpureus]|uniref:DUF3025 domain-containing protein n=1 Tax=Chitiniphilus purpureus TaxID=2981137 RepID=A0ABY6DY47_9NEIS|nr:DUF3025 domain-containing protein [Chitiniphilus sp. CD1]UXY16768.1 DUF3025 domain-containing protein [Chitiniphilus sp. CD1]
MFSRHPAFAALAPLLAHLGGFPRTSADWARLPPVQVRSGHRIVCVPPAATDGHYEAQIHETGRLPTRPLNWHDCFNALVWHRYPRIKAALNALHYRLLPHPGDAGRGPVRDAATLLDECGLIVPYCDATLHAALLQHDWSGLFVAQRAAWGVRIEAQVLGHATFEHLLAPFVGLTGKCWPVAVAPEYFGWPLQARLAWLDDTLAQAIDAGALQSPRQLPPLPYLGIPGWWPQQDTTFYADTGYFRPARRLPAGSPR